MIAQHPSEDTPVLTFSDRYINNLKKGSGVVHDREQMIAFSQKILGQTVFSQQHTEGLTP